MKTNQSILFTCMHCRKNVFEKGMGVKNRNHCPFCLWSKHVDTSVGDRKSSCLGEMEPIGLTFKSVSSGGKGELMIIHQCTVCQKLSLNRIAADDSIERLQFLFSQSTNASQEFQTNLLQNHIQLLSSDDKRAFEEQLFGKQ